MIRARLRLVEEKPQVLTLPLDVLRTERRKYLLARRELKKKKGQLQKDLLSIKTEVQQRLVELEAYAKQQIREIALQISENVLKTRLPETSELPEIANDVMRELEGMNITNQPFFLLLYSDRCPQSLRECLEKFFPEQTSASSELEPLSMTVSTSLGLISIDLSQCMPSVRELIMESTESDLDV